MRLKHLVIAFLVSQLFAFGALGAERTFFLNWSGQSFDNDALATGVIVIDDAVLLNPGNNYSDGSPFVVDFTMTVGGASSGDGTFDLADFDYIKLDTGGGTLDLSRELVGQPTLIDPWGTPSGGDGGDFNVLSDPNAPSGAPNGTWYFELTTDGGGGDSMLLTSFRPGCPPDPSLASCTGAAKDIVKVKDDSEASKDQFMVKLVNAADAIAQADFGDPVTGGNWYDVCVYDTTGDVPALKTVLSVPGGGTCQGDLCWTVLSDKGWKYKDESGAHSGVEKILLKGGDAGKGKIIVKAKGKNTPLPGPLSGSEYFDIDTSVIVQIYESGTGNCWESIVGSADVKKNTDALFKAVRK